MPVIDSKLLELQTRIDHLQTMLHRSEINAITAITSITLILSETISFITRLDDKIRERR